jgi:TonB-linked SusC/RagA family outer membrane protein
MDKRKHIVRQGVLLLLFFLGFAGIMHAQNVIKGTVIDDAGYPIKIARITSGNETVIADENGTFTIGMSDAIRIESAGFKPRIFHPPYADIFILREEERFSQMVDVAYAGQNRFGLTPAVSAISGERLKDSYVTNIGNTLLGKIPGLMVFPSSGEPGNDHPGFQIRGVATLNNAEPLVYVDGIEMPMNLLKTEEIKSISVLKDAAALAPFGIKGANGVIWITTKRGTPGRPELRTSVSTGNQQPLRIPEFISSYDYARLYNEARSNDNNNIWSPLYSDAQLNAYNNPSSEIANYDLLYPNVNWYDEVLKNTAPTTNADFSFSGGDNNARYFLMLGYQFTEGHLKDTDLKRNINSNNDYQKVNVRGNVDLNLPSIFDATFMFGGVIEDRYTPSYSLGGLWNNMARYPANAFPVETPEGWGGTSLHPDNPKATVLQQGYRHFHNRTVRTSLTLGQDLGFITPGLRLTETYALANYQGSFYYKYRDYQRYQPFLNQTDEIGYNVIGSEQTDFTISQTGTARNTFTFRQNFQVALSYDRQFNSHHLQGLMMYSHDEYLIEGMNPVFYTRGFAGRIVHNYSNRYITEFGYAYNGTGDFPAGNRMGFFPALSFAWIVSNEDFLAGSQSIDFLKIRTSAGIVGNSNIGGQRFSYQQYYRQANSTPRFGWPGTATSSILYEYQIANSSLTWEKAFKSNFGIETLLFSKLDVSADLFYERRSDILVNQNVLSSLGFLTGMVNEGEVTNRGIELDLRWSDKVGALSYFVNPIFAFARNRIEQMNEPPRAQDYLVRTGHSINQPFALQAAGFFQSWDEINHANTPVQTFASVQPGDIRYIDQNGDGIIDDNDLIPMAGYYSNIPEITYGLSIGLAFKGFDLHVFGYGASNRSVFLSGINFWAFQNQGNATPWALERWAHYPGQGIDTRATATYPRLSLENNSNNFRNSSFWIRNGNYFRLGEVTIGYTLPQSFTSKINIKKTRLYFTGTNLLTFDNINTVDPVVMTGYAFMKSFNLGLNLNF